MAAPVITTGILTGGSNSHTTSSEEVNGLATDLVSEGVVGTITNTSGVSPATGSFAVNATATPDANINISTGVAYVTGTPTSQNSQTLRVKCSTTGTLAISANSSGSTKYDWIYIKLDATKMANPAVGADDVATIVASRSTSASADDGTPPTYGYPIAVVTVSNGFSTITNGNIRDIRTATSAATPNVSQNFSETSFDFVASGCVWSGDSYASTLAASMTAGVVYIGGARVTVLAVTARTFTASKDTYIDVDSAGTLTYTEVTNNAASPALTASNIRLGIVVSGGSSIAAATSINQGQENRVVPTSTNSYSVTDSLGNLICPRDPQRRLLGYRQITTTISTSSATYVDMSGLTVPVIVPTGRKIEISIEAQSWSSSGTGVGIYAAIVESSTVLTFVDNTSSSTANGKFTLVRSVVLTPSAGSHSYKAQYKTDANTLSIQCGATTAAFIRVKLI